MAFFKFRKGSDDKAAPPPKAESIEAIRRRAMHRLIGAAVLVLAGVIGFPMLFDSQPRPIAVDIPIEIPDKAKVRPLAGTPPLAEVAEVASAPVAANAPAAAPVPAPQVAPDGKKDAEIAKLEEKVPVVPVKPTNNATETVAKVVETPAPAKADPKADVKADAKVEPKPSAQSLDSAKAQALLDGKPVAKAPDSAAGATTDGRFVVQVGAFADATRAREARSKLEAAGMKTYTQVVDTKDGPRTRVRVGPFSDRAEADRAAQKVKALALTATVLTL